MQTFCHNRLTVYPKDSAMHGCWEVRCFGGWLCVFPPVMAFGARRGVRAYWSPNATPWHHRARHLWRSRPSMDCSCGEVACTKPRIPALDALHALHCHTLEA